MRRLGGRACTVGVIETWAMSIERLLDVVHGAAAQRIDRLSSSPQQLTEDTSEADMKRSIA
jgi:hypothetical protein